jgi:hypothetical protein
VARTLEFEFRVCVKRDAKRLHGFEVRMAFHLPPKGLQGLERRTTLPSLRLDRVLCWSDTGMDVVRRRPCRWWRGTDTTVVAVVQRGVLERALLRHRGDRRERRCGRGRGEALLLRAPTLKR